MCACVRVCVCVCVYFGSNGTLLFQAATILTQHKAQARIRKKDRQGEGGESEFDKPTAR